VTHTRNETEIVSTVYEMVSFKGLAREDEVVHLLSDLVSVESVNPALMGGQRGEAAVA